MKCNFIVCLIFTASLDIYTTELKALFVSFFTGKNMSEIELICKFSHKAEHLCAAYQILCI